MQAYWCAHTTCSRAHQGQLCTYLSLASAEVVEDSCCNLTPFANTRTCTQGENSTEQPSRAGDRKRCAQACMAQGVVYGSAAAPAAGATVLETTAATLLRMGHRCCCCCITAAGQGQAQAVLRGSYLTVLQLKHGHTSCLPSERLLYVGVLTIPQEEACPLATR